MNFWIILFLFTTSFVLRITTNFDDNNVLLLMSLVNTLAFLIIFVSIFEKIVHKLDKKIEGMSFPNLSFNMEGNVKKTRTLCYFVIIPLCVAYNVWFKNALINDLLSIVSLALSITDEDLSNLIADRIFRKK